MPSVSRVRHFLRENWPLFLMMLVAAVLYSTYGLLRHWRFGSSGYDLGIFDQAIWHYSRFQAPADTVRGVSNLLGDHFHPLLVILAPFYWIAPRAETLIILQALLFALAAWPIFLYARKRLGTLAAYFLTGGYLAFWGIAAAAAYDFHEIALAVPLIALAIYALSENKMRVCLMSLGLLLLVKEDQALLVMVFGVLMLVYKKWGMGLFTLIVSTAWFFLAIKVLIPHFAGMPYMYWSYAELGPNAPSAVLFILQHPITTLKIAIHPHVKVTTIRDLFAAVFALPIFSPLLILTLPLLAARFLSTNASYWGKNFHYSATIAPVLFMAAADGLGRLGRYIQAERLRRHIFIGMGGLMLVVNLVLLYKTPFRSLLDPSFYGIPSEIQPGYTALSLIPAQASVTAQDAIVPHLSDRAQIYNISPDQTDVPETDYILASSQVSPWPEPNQAAIDTYLSVKEKTYTVIFNQDGWIVLRKK